MKVLHTQASAVYLDLEWDSHNGSKRAGSPPKIIEIGLVELNPASLEIVREANLLVRPRRVDISIASSTLTGISRNDLLHAKTFKEVISEISNSWPAKATCFAWGNDGEILSRTCQDHRVAVLFRRFVDLSYQIQHTLLLSQPLSVQHAVETLGLAFDGVKRIALADSRNAARVHSALLRRIRSYEPPPIVHQDDGSNGGITWFGQVLQSSIKALELAGERATGSGDPNQSGGDQRSSSTPA